MFLTLLISYSPFSSQGDTFFQDWANLITPTSNFFYLPMQQNSGNGGGAGSKEEFFKKLSLLHYVWMHSLCIFDHAFLPHPKPFLCRLFSSNSYGCLVSTHEIFSPLKSGSKVEIKNLELSRLLKIKKIPLSMLGIFHISIKSTFFHMERSGLKSPTTRISFGFE